MSVSVAKTGGEGGGGEKDLTLPKCKKIYINDEIVAANEKRELC